MAVSTAGYADDIEFVRGAPSPLERLLGQVAFHTGGYTALAQPVRCAAGRAVAYRCESCGAWHPWAEKLRDPATGLYHGIDCESPEYLASQAGLPRAAIEVRWARARGFVAPAGVR